MRTDDDIFHDEQLPSELCINALEEYHKGNLAESLRLYQEAELKCHAGKMKAAILANIGSVLMDLGKYPEAANALGSSLETDVAVETVWNYSICMLHLGNLKEGLSLYKARYHRKEIADAVKFPNLPIPQCAIPKDMFGKNVLVLNEQGFGDEIMFSLGLSILPKYTTSHKVQCYPEIERLFNSLYPGFSFFSNRQLSYDFVMSFDCWTCTGDLFSWSMTELTKDKFPTSIAEKFTKTMQINENRKIGVCLSCKKTSKNYSKRSIDIDEALNKINPTKNTKIYSLQKEVPLQTNKIEINTQLIDECQDFHDTASLINSLDEIFTCDTAIAHLAGILNKPTTLLFGQYRDWRWKYKRDNIHQSYFFPSVKI